MPTKQSPAPTITKHGIGCTAGYGIYLTGVFPDSVYATVLDSSKGTVLNRYQQGNSAPYTVLGGTLKDNGDGTHTFSFCMESAAEHNALDANGVTVFLTDVLTYLEAHVTISRTQP